MTVDLLGYYHSGFMATQALRTPGVRIPTQFTSSWSHKSQGIIAICYLLFFSVFAMAKIKKNPAIVITA